MNKLSTNSRLLAILLVMANSFLPAQASPIINNTGLAAPGATITFSEVSLATDAVVTNQFAAFGATFSPNLYYDPQAGLFPTPALGNYNNSGFPLINPVSILFTKDVTAAAVAVQTGTGTSTFTALLDGVVVETFSAPTNATAGHASDFFGFTNIVFDELRIQGTPALLIDNLQFNVKAAPNAGTLSGTQGICVGGTTTFTSTIPGGTFSSSAPGVGTVDPSSGLVSGVTPGTATITYTVAGSGGSADATATRTVTVTAAPNAGTLSGIQGICVGGTTTFTVIGNSSAGTFSSSAPGVATVNSSSGLVSGLAPGTATITYTVAGAGGCANATTTRTVTITGAPNAGTLSGTQGICVGGTTTFASTIPGGTFSSSAPGVATVNPSSGMVNGIAPGTATISYTVAGSGGCADATTTRTVNVTAAPNAGTLSGIQGICVGGTTTFTVSGNSSAGTFSSSAPGVATVDPSSGVINGVAPGTATITYTVAGAGGCANATTTRTVTVNATPNGCSITSIPASGPYTGDNDPTHLYLGYGPQSTTLQVAALPPGGAPYTYAWSPASGLSSTNSSAPVFTPTAGGNYTFTVIITNKYGCSSTCSITICVLDIRVPGKGNGAAKKVYVCHVPPGNPANAHTLEVSVNAVSAHISNPGHGDRLGKCNETPCGPAPVASIAGAVNGVANEINPEASFKVIVSSNPAKHQFSFNVRSNVDAPVSIRLFNSMGQVVDGVSKVNANSTINLGARLGGGAYMAEVTQGNNRKMISLIKLN